MAGEQHRQQVPAQGLDPEPGTQTLVTVDSMRSPFQAVPPDATGPVLVISSRAPDEMTQRLRARGIAPNRAALFPISGGPVGDHRALTVLPRTVPDDLTGLSMRLTDALAHLTETGGWLVLDTLNVFLLYADEARVVRFMHHLTVIGRQHALRGLYLLVSEAVTAETVSALSSAMDRTVDLD